MCIFAYQVPWVEIVAWHLRCFGVVLIYKLDGIRKHMKMNQWEDLLHKCNNKWNKKNPKS